MSIQYKIHIDKIFEDIERARLSVNAHHIVKIVSVSKYNTSEDIKALYDIGQRAFGENKVQDLMQKTEILEELPLEWHFIGNLQKNKINNLIKSNPSMFQALDSIELAKELQLRLSREDMVLDTLLQINSANEESKHGFSLECAKDSFDQIKELCPNINIKGLMSIGAHSDNEKDTQKSFEDTKNLYDTLDNVNTLSMGMSADFELAIKCGSNMVRLGSRMFNY